MLLLTLYIILFVLSYFAYSFITSRLGQQQNNNAGKTITFGDESTVRPNRAASVISVVVLFFIWCAFTGSQLSPIHVPGPFTGDTSFSYTASNADGQMDKASVYIRVKPVGEKFKSPTSRSRTPALQKMML